MPNRLMEMVNDLDRLHANAWLDVRHRELFQSHAHYLWPRLSAKIREMVRRVSNE